MKLIRRTAPSLFLLALALPSSAQWLKLKTPGIPRTADGKPNLTAPTPRTADGRPDLSGLWHNLTDKYDNNIAADLKPGDVAPWAEALYQKRKLEFGKDSPSTTCMPHGPNYTVSPYYDTRIVQTPTLISFVNSDLTHREIFLDGRELEKDPNPTWMGYSVGHWEGDTLVVESNGYNDKTWLDGDGHPHTEDLRVTERYHRVDVGHMDSDLTFTDPKVFPKPLIIHMKMDLRADTEMLEYVCDNEKDKAHMTSAKSSDIVTVTPEVLARYVGIYDVEDEGKKVPTEFTLKDGVLYYNWNNEGSQPTTPFGQNLFSLAGTWIEFVTDGDKPATGVRIKAVEGEDYGPRRK